ncbi:HDOD domain-containing protein [Frateuria hangzhouensis]|uniref:HDOD domain-containing protein n=1 Tax=Frateuria hangzhouensis TaxID=2995589 RepID=UPI002260C115|nr:HDOD domain-containing protein [Frateuria sp. STR12]MCX7514408.1 HDOD domain-containing protein [Frateuria sp. STR12]
MAAPVDAGPPLALVEDRFHRFVLGLPDATGDAASPVEQATLRRLEAIGERFDVSGLPRLPSVLPQLLRALKNDNLGGAQLAAMIGRDPVLVGEVMRMAGSAHFRSAQPIHSLQHAVVLLGRDALRQVATLHVMKPILQASAGMRGHMAGPWLWEHAERCAHAAAFLGRHGGCDTFEAFLAGMVCHTGTGAVVRLLDQEAPSSLGPFSPPFLAGCMRIGARLSLRAVRHWDMPATVIAALVERVDPSESPASALGKVLTCADPLAMVQLLIERGRLDAGLDYSGTWPTCFPSPVLLRAQQDLRRQFMPAQV